MWDKPPDTTPLHLNCHVSNLSVFGTTPPGSAVEGPGTYFLSWTIGTDCIGPATLGPGTFTNPVLNRSGRFGGRGLTGDWGVGTAGGGGDAIGTILAASNCSAMLVPDKTNHQKLHLVHFDCK